MKLIKKLLGIIFLVMSIFIVIVGIYGFFDMDLDVSSKIAIELIIFIVFLVPFLLGIKLLFNYNIFKKKNDNKADLKVDNSKKTKEKSINTYIIESPFYGYKVLETENGEEWKYFTGKEVYNWLSNDDIDGINWSWNSNNIVEYISNVSLKKKISDIQLYLNKNGTCRFFVEVLEELSEVDKKLIINFIKGQLSDGWGEGNFDYEDEKGEKFKLSFWKNDGSWYIKYIEDELFEKFINMFKCQTEKECYKVDLIEDNPQIMDNKIGGKPYIPINEEYPLDKNGNPMLLLLQVNLKDIKLDGYPKEGILEIFIDQECSYPCDYKIKYFDDNQEYRRDLPELKSEYLIIDKSYKIKLNKTVEYMNVSDFRYWEIFQKIVKDIYGVNPNEYDIGFDNYKHNYSKKIEKVVYSTQSISIGGYAAFNQEDPRTYEKSVTDKTECIFKLDSMYDSKNIHVGDGGIIFALISKEDLKNRNFENTYVDWDCC